MITVIHGGQTGVDRGAHQAAIDNGWLVSGYMPRDGRDELGAIPRQVAQFLMPCTRSGYGARTEENVQIAHALLVVVYDADDPRATPGTAKTIDLAARRRLPREVADPRSDARQLARWVKQIFDHHVMFPSNGHVPLKLMIAGPRESKWKDARVQTAGLVRRIGVELQELRSASSVGSLLLKEMRR